MIKLSTLNNIAAAAEQQEAQQSTLARKAAESAAQPQEYKLTPEAQSIVDEVQAGRERDQIRRRLMLYNDAMMQQAAGPVSPFANGGGIHIDPSKRGTFTAAASRHGMGVQEFAAHVHAHPENYSPAMRRKANFARNAAKWHDAGGPLNVFGDGRSITIRDIPRGYVDLHPDMRVVPPSGSNNAVTLSEAWDKYGATPVNTEDIPGLTDYLTEQEQTQRYQDINDLQMFRRRDALNREKEMKQALYNSAIFAVTAGVLSRLPSGALLPDVTAAATAAGEAAPEAASSPSWWKPIAAGAKNVWNGVKGVVNDARSFMGDFYDELGFDGSMDFQRRAMFPTRTVWSNWVPGTLLRLSPEQRYLDAKKEQWYNDHMKATGFTVWPKFSNASPELLKEVGMPDKFFNWQEPDQESDYYSGAGGGSSWGDEATDNASDTVPELNLVKDIVIPAVTNIPVNFNAYGGPVNSYAYAGYIDPNLSIYDALTMAGIPFKTSNPSGYRGPGHYVGKARENSAHAKRRKDGTAYALDITGDFDEIRRRINASKPLQDYFAANGFGVHEELTKEALKKTGGTGPHFHIGLLSGKHVGDSGASYAHSHPGISAGEYPTSLPIGSQILATISPDSSQSGFTPWWSQAGQYDDDFLAQQALGAAGGAYDMSTFVPSWVEPTSTPATFPDLFS